MGPDAKGTGFMDGHLEYTAETLTAEEVAKRFGLDGWVGGYLAFSRGEKVLDDPDLATLTLAGLLGGRVDGIRGLDGYLMEVGLWRQDGTRHKEVSIEREDRGFFVQHWELFTNCPEGKVNCHYRYAATSSRGNSIFRDKASLESIEVIVPDSRLHFFITTQRVKVPHHA